MKTQNIFSFAIIFLTLVSCGGSENNSNESSNSDPDGDGYEGITIEDDVVANGEAVAVSWIDMRAKDVETKSPVFFEGYVGELGAITDQSKPNMFRFSVNIYQRRNQLEGFYLAAKFNIGDENNQIMKLPEEDFGDSDIKITTDDGTVVKVGDYIRIEGVYIEDSFNGMVSIDGVTKIEKVEPPIAESIFDQAIELTDEIIDDEAPFEESIFYPSMNSNEETIYAYMDVELGGSKLETFNSDRYVCISVQQSNNTYLNDVELVKGDGSSMTARSEDSEGPFMLKDMNGEEFDSTKKIRVYGTFVRKRAFSGGDFIVEEIVLL